MMMARKARERSFDVKGEVDGVEVDLEAARAGWCLLLSLLP